MVVVTEPIPLIFPVWIQLWYKKYLLNSHLLNQPPFNPLTKWAFRQVFFLVSYNFYNLCSNFFVFLLGFFFVLFFTRLRSLFVQRAHVQFCDLKCVLAIFVAIIMLIIGFSVLLRHHALLKISHRHISYVPWCSRSKWLYLPDTSTIRQVFFSLFMTFRYSKHLGKY